MNKELTNKQIEAGWHATFSTNNPYCPCDLKTFTKVTRWAEREIARRAGAAQPASHPDESVWLIERRKDGRTTGYWGASCGLCDWQPTPEKGIRYARREDASAMADCMETEDVIVAEHIWQARALLATASTAASNPTRGKNPQVDLIAAAPEAAPEGKQQ